MEMSKMTDKLTPNTMKDQYDHQWNVFCRKNHDYGNSFEKSLDTFGLVAGIVRMNDKFERLVSLNDPSKDAQIASESLVDTLEDLSNYAAMAACWMKGKKKADWNELRMKDLDGNIESIIKNADTTVVKSEIFSHGGTSSVDTETGAIYFMPGRCNGKSASVQQAIKEALDKDIEFEDDHKIIYTPNFTKMLLKGQKEKNDDVDVYWLNKLIDNMTVGDIKIEDNPEEFIQDAIKQISDTVLMKERKGELLVYMDISDDAGRIAKCVIDNDIPRNKYMGIISRYWHSLGINMPVELREFIYGVLNRYIYYMKKERGLLNVDSSPINLNHKPDFDIKLNLEPYLKEHSKKCDEKRLDQAIDLFKYNAMAQAKSQKDIDELFERMLDGSLVSRVVSNGDGTFVAYWEPAEKEEDDED
jgi:phage protein